MILRGIGLVGLGGMILSQTREPVIQFMFYDVLMMAIVYLVNIAIKIAVGQIGLV